MENTTKKFNNVEHRSEEVQEIMSRVPSWILRWGNLLFLLIILLVFIGSFLIPYQETVPSTLKFVSVDSLKTNDLEGIIMLSSSEIGKIKKGQEVIVRFDVYPEQEYGYIKGIVSSFNLVPFKNSLYKVEISFPNGNRTNEGKEIEIIEGMEAHAAIIIKEDRIIKHLIK